MTVKIQTPPKLRDLAVVQEQAVGLDLGLKDLFCSSDGEQVQAQQFYRDLEPALAVAQRAGHKARVQAIHAKIANRRKDHLHKLMTALTRTNQAVFLGNVDASALAQIGMAKSVLDAGWSALRTMLQYKCDDAGVWFKEVDERYSTQDCSTCGPRPAPPAARACPYGTGSVRAAARSTTATSTPRSTSATAGWPDWSSSSPSQWSREAMNLRRMRRGKPPGPNMALL